MIVIFISVTLLWCLLVILLIAGWQKAVRQPVTDKTASSDFPEPVQIAVIIAVRNEEKFIGALLDDLSVQTRTPQQIIVVDDHSSDNTKNIVRSKTELNNAIILLELTVGEGKKKALEMGIHHAVTPVVATTDADCRVNEYWVEHIQRSFAGNSVKMLAGAVRIRQDGTLFSALQAMEFSSLIGSGAATVALGIPTMCNGANLAFRKEIFQQAGGYSDNSQVPTGDDVFLMRQTFRQYPRGITFNANSQSVVETQPARTLNDFIHQRIRWASKWNLHPRPDNAFMAVFVFLSHLSIAGLWLSLIFKPESAGIVLILLLIRAGAEFFFLRKVLAFIGSPWRWSAFILLQVVYSFYVVIVAILANTRSYSWKGRKFG